MTVLSAAQSAATRLLPGTKLTALFGAADVFPQELAELATDVAIEISKAYDWQLLKKLASLPGDGVSLAFDLPSDYGRMTKVGRVHSKNWQTKDFTPVRDEDQWIYIQDTAVTGTPGQWILLGGKMQIYPPMPVGELARFYYVSKNVVATAAGAAGTKPGFTLDADVFVLPERLLTLGLMWRWRSQKRMEYSEDMASYELALEKEIAFDKGARKLVVGRQRSHSDAAIAYPGTLGH